MHECGETQGYSVVLFVHIAHCFFFNLRLAEKKLCIIGAGLAADHISAMKGHCVGQNSNLRKIFAHSNDDK